MTGTDLATAAALLLMFAIPVVYVVRTRGYPPAAEDTTDRPAPF